MSSLAGRIAIGACISLFLASCAPYVVEADRVGFKTIEFDEQAEQLHVAGGVRKGLHVISSTSMTNRGNDLIIEMQIQITRRSLVRSGKTGDFDFHLSLEGGVQRVLFGTERKVIWERPPAK